MSLINQMLKDLDARSKQGQPVAAMPSAVRAVPEYPPPSRGWHWMLALALALLVLVLCFAWFIPRAKLEWHRSAATQSGPASSAPAAVAAQPTSSQATPRPTPAMPPPQAAPQAAGTLPADPASAQRNAPEAASAAPPGLAPEERAADQKGLKLRLIPELKLLVQDNIGAPKPEQKTSLRSPAAVASEASAVTATTSSARREAGNSGSAVVLANNGNQAEGVKQTKPLSLQQRAENEYRRALQLQQQGRQQDAMAALEQALQLERQHTAARQTLVAWLLDQGQRDEAMRHLKEGLAHDPGQAGLAMILARLQVDQGQVALALATLQRSLPYTLEGADYHAFMAALLQRQQNHKGAIEHYQIALRLQPENALWWMGTGISYQAERQNAAARDAFTRAKNNPGLTPGFSAELQAFVEQKLNQLP